ncbi:hypothetical protein B5S25_00925 [Paenibacillus larvae subsp. pulvifaciens]|nr:hypothetical protein B5S25_00925 [Paenibacillus larvae subsp. pulvifaciens]
MEPSKCLSEKQAGYDGRHNRKRLEDRIMNQALCGNPELQVMDPYVHLSESLEEMKQEHHELLLKLQELHAVARSIGYDEQVPDWSVKLEGLKDLVEQFRFRFMRHNKKEETTLYPVVDLYTGDKMGPTSVMRQEYRMAMDNFQHFIDIVAELPDESVKECTAKKAVSHVQQTYFILTEFIRKEKEWVFPLSEQMLTDIEHFYS